MSSVWILVIIIALIVLFLGFFPIVEVCGYSMYPTLKDGELFLSTRKFRRFNVGEIYVLVPPSATDDKVQYVVKRLTGISDDHKLYFEGDNSGNSYDSRNYGFVDPSRVVSKYLFMIHRKKN